MPNSRKSAPSRAWPQELSLADYMHVAGEIRTAVDSDLEPVKVGFLTAFSFQFAEPSLVVEGAVPASGAARI